MIQGQGGIASAGGVAFEFAAGGPQYRRMRAQSGIAALAALLPAVAGCGAPIREESLTERCGAAMVGAFPGGDIEIAKGEVSAEPQASLATQVVTVEGARQRVAPGGVPLREVAVECRFDQGILTGFRWTRGPLR
jgi:hypothetical protein